MRQPGESIFINRSFAVVSESADWIVVDKPAHLLVHPTAPHGTYTLLEGLQELLAFEMAAGGQVSLINRLDRETSGLVLAAKHSCAARVLSMAMQSRLVKKRYLALVHGHPSWSSHTLDAPLLRQGSVSPSKIYLRQMVHPAGAEACTHFSVLSRYVDAAGQPFSLIEAVPITGRTHQIRVHCASLGHPVVGDKIYGPDEGCYLEFIETGWTDSLADRLLLPRHALHSASLTLPELDLAWECALPEDLQKFIHRLSCSHA